MFIFIRSSTISNSVYSLSEARVSRCAFQWITGCIFLLSQCALYIWPKRCQIMKMWIWTWIWRCHLTFLNFFLLYNLSVTLYLRNEVRDATLIYKSILHWSKGCHFVFWLVFNFKARVSHCALYEPTDGSLLNVNNLMNLECQLAISFASNRRAWAFQSASEI